MEENLKICHIISGLNTGGAEMVLYKLLSTKSLKHFDHVIVSLKDEGTIGEYIKELGVPVFCLGMSPGRPTPKGGWRLIKLIRKLKPDIIQGWMYEGNFAAFLACIIVPQKSKLLWSIHSSLHELKKATWLTRILIRWESKLSFFPAFIHFSSRISKEQHEKFGFSSKRSLYIPNGVDCDQFKPDVNAHFKLCSSLNIDSDAFLIGRIARFHAAKDYPSLILAAEKILCRFPHVHFVLSGRQVVQSNSYLVTMIQDTGFGENFHLLGDRRDILEIMAGLDVHVSSSRTEAFPLVIGETMACGVPNVVTDVGDCREIVGKTGIVVPPKDHEALANGLETYIKMSSKERFMIGKAARNRIVSQFSLTSIAKQYEALYRQFLNEKN